MDGWAGGLVIISVVVVTTDVGVVGMLATVRSCQRTGAVRATPSVRASVWASAMPPRRVFLARQLGSSGSVGAVLGLSLFLGRLRAAVLFPSFFIFIPWVAVCRFFLSPVLVGRLGAGLLARCAGVRALVSFAVSYSALMGWAVLKCCALAGVRARMRPIFVRCGILDASMGCDGVTG